MRILTSWSAQHTAPCRSSLPVQRRILRAELWALWQAIILSEPGATFVSDCATVLRGLERWPKWCTAARRPHADVWRRIWDCFRDIGDEAHVDSVAKCKAHLSKAERAKLDGTCRFMAAGNQRADELAKEGARDDSFQSILYDTYKASCRNVQGDHRLHWRFDPSSESRRVMAGRDCTASRMGRER